MIPFQKIYERYKEIIPDGDEHYIVDNDTDDDDHHVKNISNRKSLKHKFISCDHSNMHITNCTLIFIVK